MPPAKSRPFTKGFNKGRLPGTPEAAPAPRAGEENTTPGAAVHETAMPAGQAR